MTRRDFADRHIGPSGDQIATMLHELGYKSLEDFVSAVLPETITLREKFGSKLPQPISEVDAITKLLKPVESTIVKMKPQYIKKFGEQKYNVLLGQYLSGQINQKRFTTELSK